ncbi:hypothetical protein [Algoriphagus zhangzhouensis]|uniref:BNR repeat-like domain-containing protein n=1 Tax=Algoriphagus zhangzhouensis TaxID=1073327 RepID=A0A1M7ZC62_9BACT|nr:hypothetical protein [Algoriphagus zhangzhouensis]TDY45486.1 hypothetical protein A8938_2083 [Algoriphagus zhangzhouensis]SHO62443.1 hypothetical protein SAMN04488108_2081 [Algoriphagus zhangzhouensis]
MIRNFLILILIGIPIFLLVEDQVFAQELEVKPVFKVDFKDPTQDKPQSKIWFSAGAWWAILPDSIGPHVWKRNEGEWIKEENLNIELRSLPGKADVYSEGGNQFIVLVGNCELKYLKLKTTSKSIRMELVNSIPIPPVCHEIETATITKDDSGTLWVGSDWNEQVLVWSSTDQGKTWSQPAFLGDSISKDDISVVSRIKGGISVVWSNQLEEAIYERVYLNNELDWSGLITVSKGNQTADDHLNSTLLEDGRLILVTKNSVDQNGQPQFVLRVREEEGKWTDFPYVNLTEETSPTRPVTTHLPNGMIIEAHTIGFSDGSAEISVNEVRIVSNQPLEVREIIRLKSANGAHLNNVSLSKQNYRGIPKGPWLILFSDRNGNIYEFDLYPLIYENHID